MKKLTMLKAALAGSVLLAASAQASVIVLDSVEWEGSTYYLLSQSLWTDAENFAQNSLGGHLATINSTSENDFLYSYWGIYSGSAYAADWLWIGLNDVENEGVYKWSSGEDFAFSNWSAGEPNNSGGNEDYIHLWQNSGSQSQFGWNDIYNDHMSFGIAEVRNQRQVEAASVPAPATLGLLMAGLLCSGFARKRKK